MASHTLGGGFMARRWFALVLSTIFVLLVSTFANYIITPILDWSIFEWIVRPVLWCAAGLLSLLIPKNSYSLHTKKNGSRIAIVLAVAYICMYVLTGFLDGFAKNIMVSSITDILRNVICLGAIAVFAELLRSRLLVNVGAHKKLIAAWVAIIFTFSDISLSYVLGSSQEAHGFTDIFISLILPSALIQSMLTLMLYRFGLPACLIFSLSTKAIEWTMPALPSSSWFSILLYSVLLPLAAIMYMAGDARRAHAPVRHKKSSKAFLVCFLSVAALLVAFFIGAFSIQPITIATGSMLPKYRVGDMVLVDKTQKLALDIGDVIQYKVDDYTVIHRIVKSAGDAEKPYYITKGDNNNSSDAHPVYMEQVCGKVVGSIPYIGVPTLWIHGKSIQSADVQVQTGE